MCLRCFGVVSRQGSFLELFRQSDQFQLGTGLVFTIVSRAVLPAPLVPSSKNVEATDFLLESR